jgi:hypothetical protein
LFDETLQSLSFLASSNHSTTDYIAGFFSNTQAQSRQMQLCFFGTQNAMLMADSGIAALGAYSIERSLLLCPKQATIKFAS